MKSKLKRYEAALREILARLNGTWHNPLITYIIEAALNPPPETEDWHVEAWAVVDSTNGRLLNFGTKEAMEICCDTKTPGNLLKVIPLVGAYPRPKKQPVERSISGQFQLNGTFRSNGIPRNDHYGKEVVITWEEPA